MLYQGIIGGGSSPVEPVDLSPVLLWTNSSPSTGFAAQTISLDLTEYAGVIVEFNWSEVNSVLSSREYIKKGETLNGVGAVGATSSSDRYARATTVNSNGVAFLNASNGSEVGNNQPIPYKIYGVKEYVVESVKPIDVTICERAYTFPATSGKTNTWTVDEDGLYFLTGEAPGISDTRGSISLIGDATLISGNEPVRVFKAKAGAQVVLIVSSGNSFTPYINRIK